MPMYEYNVLFGFADIQMYFHTMLLWQCHYIDDGRNELRHGVVESIRKENLSKKKDYVFRLIEYIMS